MDNFETINNVSLVLYHNVKNANWQQRIIYALVIRGNIRSTFFIVENSVFVPNRVKAYNVIA